MVVVVIVGMVVVVIVGMVVVVIVVVIVGMIVVVVVIVVHRMAVVVEEFGLGDHGGTRDQCGGGDTGRRVGGQTMDVLEIDGGFVLVAVQPAMGVELVGVRDAHGPPGGLAARAPR